MVRAMHTGMGFRQAALKICAEGLKGQPCLDDKGLARNAAMARVLEQLPGGKDRPPACCCLPAQASMQVHRLHMSPTHYHLIILDANPLQNGLSD